MRQLVVTYSCGEVTLTRDIGQLMSTLRKERGLSQERLAELLNCTKQTISNYECNKRRPDYEMLEAIADVLNVPMAFFISKEEQREELDKIYGIIPPKKRKGRIIPVLGTIPAGVPLEAIEDVLDYEELPESMFSGGREYFALKIKGDSMMPRYEDGDVVILRQQDSCESGQDCAVLVNGNDATFKRVRMNEKTLTLQPLNPAYEPMVYTTKEVVDLPVRILGVAVEIRRTV